MFFSFISEMHIICLCQKLHFIHKLYFVSDICQRFKFKFMFCTWHLMFLLFIYDWGKPGIPCQWIQCCVYLFSRNVIGSYWLLIFSPLITYIETSAEPGTIQKLREMGLLASTQFNKMRFMRGREWRTMYQLSINKSKSDHVEKNSGGMCLQKIFK